ncbi:hypothetical protein D9M72_437850 [compost metagenome]
MPIHLPEVSPKRELARKLLDAVLAGLPLFGGPLAAIYSVTFPAKTEVEESEWKKVVTDKLNLLETALDYVSGEITLSEEAALIGRWISVTAEDGWQDVFSEQTILGHFAEATADELLLALGELELEGMLRISYNLNTIFSHVLVMPKLYEAFDPIVFPGVSPREDAALIANALISSSDGVSAHEFAVEQGWSIRRTNAALGVVDKFIAPGRKSQPYGVEYGIRSMFADASEKASLRRFVNEVLGS